MKIGLVLPSTPNYSETFFSNKIKGLQRNGYEVLLFVQTKRPDFKGYPVYLSPKVINNKMLQLLKISISILKLIPHYRRLGRYYRILKEEDFKLSEILKRIYLNSHILPHQLEWLHFGFATQALGSEFVAKAINAKMATSFRGFDINVYPKKHPNCYHKLWQRLDRVHSISNYLVKEAYKQGLSTSVPIKIIPPAIDDNMLQSNAHSLTENDLIICTAARLNWIKDITTALKTIKILKPKYPNLVYKIVGSGSQSEQERYRYITKQLGLVDCVTFYDQLSHNETIRLVRSCDIYLQTSLNEGFCNALLEAQALGKLCVATNVGGLSENIKNGQTGFLVPPQNPTAIAEKIEEVYNLPDHKKSAIALNAQRRVKEYFQLKDQEAAFIDFYSN